VLAWPESDFALTLAYVGKWVQSRTCFAGDAVLQRQREVQILCLVGLLLFACLRPH
jgi:hypothetical protein